MPIRINGATSGYTSLEAPAVAGTTTVTLPAQTVDLSTLGAAWTSFTPSWTNLTVGNATNTGRWMRVGSLVVAQYNLVFGSSTSVSGIFYPALPTNYAGAPVGFGWGYDDTAVAWASTVFTAGAYLTTTARFNATFPWTWAVNDIIRLSITYEYSA